MNEERPPADAAQARLPDKPFLTAEQLEEIWNMRGMKYRVDELHKSMIERGLLPSVQRPDFRQVVRSILSDFLVDGRSKRQPKHDPIPRFPKVS
jgi:hypothetical protein